MIYPNNLAATFCYWLLNISFQALSGPQKTVVQTIQSAALSAGSVTSTQWDNFQRFTAWRYPYFLVWYELQGVLPTNLASKAKNAYNFEGNANDSIAGANGTPTSLTYSTSYGVVDQGVQFDGTNSQLNLPGLVLTANCALSFWINVRSEPTALAPIIVRSSDALGIWYESSSNKILVLDGVTRATNTALTLSAWNHVCLVTISQKPYVYINGVLDYWSFSNLSLLNLSQMGKFTATYRLNAYIDALTFFQYSLSAQEVAQLASSSPYIQYPFTPV